MTATTPTRPPAALRALAVIAVLGLAACNTVQGVGRDVQAGGRAITGAGAATGSAIGRAASPAPAEEPAKSEPTTPAAPGS